MKIKDLIVALQKLDAEKNIFLQNFMMCDEFEIHQIKKEHLWPWTDWINENNIWDYYIAENEEWLNRNSK
ncbi:MAG: hypothetical protein ACD_3C00049G0007 [uncultured bacterium (gcode 4)]|uniref:Uncharacterized protein n=1 Tax=uncultured bacterium (gcode 4) TaxID=1234023 RepID=K2GYK8_9BACT|nr:MAG: hypothetical protein ACD_3C00049G0007 [uncultured bacterium (gcode 4)]